MLKTFKKSIALFVALVFVLSLVPFSAMAETTESEPIIVRFSNPMWYGTSGTHTTTPKAYNSYLRTGGIYHAFCQLNFSGYEYLLRDDSTSLTVSLGATSNSGRLLDLGLYPHLDSADKYADYYSDSLTYEIVKNDLSPLTADYINNTTPFFVKTSTDNINPYSSDGNKQVILNALSDSTDDSIITFAVVSLSGTEKVGFTVGSANTYVQINGGEDATPKNYLESIKGELWNAVSDEPQNNVMSPLNLPTKYKGVNIVWSSSNEDVVNPLSGEINPDIVAGTQVTLTANMTYTNYLNTTVTDTATFDITVAKPVIETTDIIPFTNAAYTRANTSNANTIYGTDERLYGDNTYRYIRFDHSNIYFANAQLDLTGYEEILSNPGTSAEISIASPYMGASGHGAYDYNVYLADDNNDSYINEELSYTVATTTYNMYDTNNRPILYTKDPANASSGEKIRGTFGGEVDVNTIKTVLDEGTDNSLVTLVFENIYPQTESTFVAISANDPEGNPLNIKTHLAITYDKNAIDNQSYISEVKNALTWNVLSKGAQNKVSADLYLPAKFKGVDIAWESDNAAVLSDGTVDFANNKGETVKLTANMTYTNILGDTVTAEKEFELKISDGTFYEVGTPTLEVDGDKFKASWNIENYTGADVTYNVYLAVYSNQELVALTPVTYVAKNGMPTSIAPTADYAQGYTAKLIAVQGENITPVFEALER